MSTTVMSRQEMTESLQRRLAFRREREKLHAEQQEHPASQEKLHGTERARHAAEIETVTRNLEELQGMAERLGEVITRLRVVPSETDEQILGRNPNLSAAVDRILAPGPPDVPFTATTMAEEIQRRYSKILRRPITFRAVGSALRRRRDQGVLVEVREGRPFEEGLYRKG